jgi:acetylornithine/succinyldiaminopimelate/putrescine aminotransferase
MLHALTSLCGQGHCHPRIVAALIAQAQKLSLGSRAFYNSMLGQFAKKVTEMFGYDMVLPMNTGAEAVETALKLSRKWAYVKKGVPDGQAIILSAEGNFHGRTMGAIRYVWIRIRERKENVINFYPPQHEYRPTVSCGIWAISPFSWSLVS